MKKISKKMAVGIGAGAALLVAVILFAAALLLRVDAAGAQNIALRQTGGGQILSQEVENEGLWNEYKYEILSGDYRYEIEINGFGKITELEAGLNIRPER